MADCAPYHVAADQRSDPALHAGVDDHDLCDIRPGLLPYSRGTGRGYEPGSNLYLQLCFPVLRDRPGICRVGYLAARRSRARRHLCAALPGGGLGAMASLATSGEAYRTEQKA